MNENLHHREESTEDRFVLQAETCVVCNEATLEYKAGFRAVGAPTEAALLVLAEKLGVASDAEQQRIHQARQQDPDGCPSGACEYYSARWAAAAL